MPAHPVFARAEHTVEQSVQWRRLIIESTGASLIALGLAIAAVAFGRAFRRQHATRASLPRGTPECG